MALTAHGCDDANLEKRQQGIEDANARRYFHQGVAAGPTMITDGGGIVIDERRFEPFGEPIDANMGLDPYNSLNKERNAETGWSYHGARWMAPQSARWLTPDPPVKAPEPKFMLGPWGLNPYAYVRQNPTMFWDPEGREDAPVDADRATVEAKLGRIQGLLDKNDYPKAVKQAQKEFGLGPRQYDPRQKGASTDAHGRSALGKDSVEFKGKASARWLVSSMYHEDQHDQQKQGESEFRAGGDQVGLKINELEAYKAELNFGKTLGLTKEMQTELRARYIDTVKGGRGWAPMQVPEQEKQSWIKKLDAPTTWRDFVPEKNHLMERAKPQRIGDD